MSSESVETAKVPAGFLLKLQRLQKKLSRKAPSHISLPYLKGLFVNPPCHDPNQTLGQ